MNSYKCRIYRLKASPAKGLILTTPLLKKLGCPPGTSVRLACGNKQVITRIASIHKKSEDALYIPQSVAEELSFPVVTHTRVLYHNKTVRLGPVIGIVTTGFTGSTEKPFGSRSSLFKQFLLAGKEESPLFFVFTPAMVDWARETISGWFLSYDPLSKQYVWRADRTPLPDVVYDRVPNRKKEADPSVVQLKERLLNHRHRIHWFNIGFFNKWEVYARLYNHPLTRTYIPETIRSPNVEDLAEMLERHRMIYLKPNKGSLGLGIIRITHHPPSGYYCRYHSSHGNVLKRFTSLEAIVNHFFRKSKGDLTKYIAQQGIRLIQHDKRPVDFRIHMHKNEDDEWTVVGMAAKVAGSGSVTTHVRTGGFVIPASELFHWKYGADGLSLQRKITRAAIHISRALEQTTPGLLGELGMDIGLDQDGRLWLFEVNAKPGRHIFYHPKLRTAGRESARYITAYSLKLANFI